MDIFSFLLLILISGVALIIFAAISAVFSKEGGLWIWFLKFIGSIILAIGAIGFFGMGLSNFGVLNWLPYSFEWPVGFADGVIKTGNGLYVVPHHYSGRVQLYDSEWKFIQGWHVYGGRGTFKLVSSGDNRFEVITSEGRHMRYVFDTDGNRISETSYLPARMDSFPNQGTLYEVPTSPWLYIFSNPIYCWIVFGIGIVFLGIVDTIEKRKKQKRLYNK
jgi:hypothetical protein